MCWFTQNSLLYVSQWTDLKRDKIHIIFTRHLKEASGRGVTELIIYTKKLPNSDWLRKECPSSVTRMQTCNTSAKLVTRLQITNGFWLAENAKETTKNQSDFSCFNNKILENGHGFWQTSTWFCTQNNNRKVKKTFQKPEHGKKNVFLAK